MELHHDASAPGGFEDAFDAAATGLADSILGIGSPRLCGMLRDPVVRAAMAAHGVASEASAALLRQIADRLADRHWRAFEGQSADTVRHGSLIAAP
jgi:hypothetical protein